MGKEKIIKSNKSSHRDITNILQRLSILETKFSYLSEKIEKIEDELKEIKDIILNGINNNSDGLIGLKAEFKLFKKVFWVLNIAILLTLITFLFK